MGSKLPKILLIAIVLGLLILLLEVFLISRSNQKIIELGKVPQGQLISSPGPEIVPDTNMVATGNIDVFLEPGNRRVGYFVKGQTFTTTDNERLDYIQVIDSNGYKLWIRKGNAYVKVEE